LVLAAVLLAGAAGLSAYRVPTPAGKGPGGTPPPGEAFEARFARSRERYEARQAVVRSVIRRETSLAEAGARFRELGREAPATEQTLWWLRERCQTDEEFHCRHVIQCVALALENDPARDAEVARLGAELHEIVARPAPSP
jgi:hypothetical protein